MRPVLSKMSKQKTVFVTGGTGYIGSHCIVDLLNEGYEVITIDNLTNSRSGALRRVEEITGKKVTFYECDLLDGETVHKIFAKHKIDYVIHFAAMKAVGESMQFPLIYYKNNVIGTINLIEAMKASNVYQMVFSSSCTVYGDPEHLPITEDHPTGAVTNVYGRTKYLIEEMLKDLSRAEEKWNIIALRYFNPVGAHPSGRLGEDPTKNFTNLMPYIGQVAIGKKPNLTIFGSDYDTPDGTGVRDYIHVMDLASGHVSALSKLDQEHLRFKTYNLGTGQGVSVLQLVKAFEAVTDTKVPYELKPRREGDIVSMFANTTLAKNELGWTAKYSLENMCEDFWRWQTMNPDGYVNDEPFLASVLEQPMAGKTADAASKVASASNGIASVNGLNGVNDH
ncbi:UDP-glucose 4-epimerase-like isoform X1 [Portunus trituberculatus]|uniref:UDP-glucose 4-epimerase-like isoform X1 n=2 Tax=Portunus trituberculatus TaxID=210409 RepID=UPI001E1D0C79|nr:UDP-glucose 4-epimerase-like isoform X1 [Portunus trituberculatus]